MKNIMYITIVLFVFSAKSTLAQTAREITEKAIDLVDFPSMEMVSTLKIYDAKGRERVRQIATASRKFGDVSKSIMKFMSPADVKGTTMLVYDYELKDDDMWIYLPALRKIRRIVSSEKGKSFMGSEFTNADMGKPNLDDFNFKFLPDETLNDKECWVVDAVCKDEDIEDENGFMRQVSWIEKTTYLCHKIEYYDLDDELHKVQSISDYEKQPSGYYFAFYLEKENVQNGRKSIMTIDKFQEGSELPESTFSPTMLDK
jgi:outer membrane lipoprotein-sorting protein